MTYKNCLGKPFENYPREKILSLRKLVRPQFGYKLRRPQTVRQDRTFSRGPSLLRGIAKGILGSLRRDWRETELFFCKKNDDPKMPLTIHVTSSFASNRIRCVNK